MENYSNIIKNNPDDDENMKVKKNVFRDNSKIDLYTFIIVTLITVIFMILPLISIFVSIKLIWIKNENFITIKYINTIIFLYNALDI